MHCPGSAGNAPRCAAATARGTAARLSRDPGAQHMFSCLAGASPPPVNHRKPGHQTKMRGRQRPPQPSPTEVPRVRGQHHCRCMARVTTSDQHRSQRCQHPRRLLCRRRTTAPHQARPIFGRTCRSRVYLADRPRQSHRCNSRTPNSSRGRRRSRTRARSITCFLRP